MGKKIIVAGAGHGGLGAAAILSRNGFDVTVIEQKKRKEMGYDWVDCTLPENFDLVGAPRPDESQMTKMHLTHYFSPAKTVLVKPYRKMEKHAVYIDRKLILDILIENAEKSGVKFIFGEKILSAVCDSERVKGILTEKGEYLCDLVIDSAGMDSPVRKSLPESFNILKEIDKEDTIYTYRAFYRHNGQISSLPEYCVYFYHCGRKSFDWVINEKEYADVLVGIFGGIDETMVKEAVDDFKADHKYISDEIVRGGQYAKIPVRKTLSKFIANSYAIIGDCASMIEPLSGSGLSLSFDSAPLLAEAIMNAEESGYSEKDLWQYQYNYFKKHIKSILHDDALKSFLGDMGAENLNTMFSKRIITGKDFYGGKMNMSEFIDKATGMISTPSVVPYFTTLGLRLKKIDKLYKSLPKEYDEQAVADWTAKYDLF